MSTLKHLNLTEKDFQLIVDGLEALPNKGMAGEMMGDLIMGLMAKEGEGGMNKIKAEREQKRLKEEKQKALMVEDIKILQGKLLMLKRYLMEQGALNETQDILNHIS